MLARRTLSSVAKQTQRPVTQALLSALRRHAQTPHSAAFSSGCCGGGSVSVGASVPAAQLRAAQQAMQAEQQTYRPLASVHELLKQQKQQHKQKHMYTSKPTDAVRQQRELEESAVSDISNYGSIDDHWEHSEIPAGDVSTRSFQYFVLGGARLLYASAARLLVVKLVASMSASADVLALSTTEVDLSGIPESSTVTVKWRGKPVFIRHRSPAEIALANSVDMAELKDPEPDSARVQDPKYLVLIGVCTHLGCVPISDAGDYHGWFCPCHGSHYDISGRIRKGPAPLNLEVPTYKLDGTNLIVG